MSSAVISPADTSDEPPTEFATSDQHPTEPVSVLDFLIFSFFLFLEKGTIGLPPLVWRRREREADFLRSPSMIEKSYRAKNQLRSSNRNR